MPHASLLGSNGHHSTFTSEMISGQINVFIVLRKKKIHTHTHTTLTHVCLHPCAHTDQNVVLKHTHTHTRHTT